MVADGLVAGTATTAPPPERPADILGSERRRGSRTTPFEHDRVGFDRAENPREESAAECPGRDASRSSASPSPRRGAPRGGRDPLRAGGNGGRSGTRAPVVAGRRDPIRLRGGASPGRTPRMSAPAADPNPRADAVRVPDGRRRRRLGAGRRERRARGARRGRGGGGPGAPRRDRGGRRGQLPGTAIRGSSSAATRRRLERAFESSFGCASRASRDAGPRTTSSPDDRLPAPSRRVEAPARDEPVPPWRQPSSEPTARGASAAKGAPRFPPASRGGYRAAASARRAFRPGGRVGRRRPSTRPPPPYENRRIRTVPLSPSLTSPSSATWSGGAERRLPRARVVVLPVVPRRIAGGAKGG